MQLEHIDIGKLRVSPLNMRHGRKAPDVSDILPSVRARGILQPLLVRPDGDDFEVVAGRRRYFAARTVADEQGEIEPLPCAILEPGDDAGALEASLIENLARLDPDEMIQHETFVRLVKEGRSVDDIAATFGLTETMVKRRLALGNLLPKIKEAYRNEQIDGETVRHLTLASKAQQKEWLALFEDPEAHAPCGYQLKQWLFGGQSISTKVALFPAEEYTGQIVTDLFGEDAYFADADLFWELQNKAIAAQRDALLAAGWTDVVLLETGQIFQSWEHSKTAKRRGGRVYISVSHQGAVEVHEGYRSLQELRRDEKSRATDDADEGSADAPIARPAMTKGMQNYLELHRHAVVRLALFASPATALRLLIAHALAPSGHWHVKTEPQQAHSEDIAKSVAASAAQQAFAVEKDEVLRLLGAPEPDHEDGSPNGGAERTAAIFARLLWLSDEQVLRVAALAMAETMAAGSPLVEAVGTLLRVDARANWQPDETFFDLVREKGTVNAMLSEVAGKAVADANLTERVRTQKQIVRDCLAGENGRDKVDRWLPGTMEFPFRGYGAGTCAIADAGNGVAALFAAR